VSRRAQRRLLVAGLAVFVVGLVAFFGDRRVSAITSSERGDPRPVVVDDVAGDVALFDRSLVHELEVEFDRRDYDRMIRRFTDGDAKEWVEADATIDGTPVDSVGLRLKGNSSLGGLRGGFGPGVGPGPGGGRLPQVPTADEPELLPWLLELDQFVEGRRYEGYEAVAVRAAGPTSPTTALGEALALRLIQLAEEPAAEWAYASFRVNDRKPALRLLVEDPDSPFAAANFEHDGVLYKSLAMGGFTNMGGDPVLYEHAFRQITRKNKQDLRPLIDLIRWTDAASDAEFAAGLADRVDVESLARYAALHNLLMNFDDMSGPGQNYYLWYDLETERFTVVTWDLNLAFTGSAQGGPFASRDFPGPGGFGRPPRRGGPPPNVGGFGPPPGSHPLKHRFLETPRFRRLYLSEYRELYEELFASGRALEELDAIEETIADSDVPAPALAREAGELRRIVRARTKAAGAALANLE
jgi:spore coat protein CotH